jgi:DNA-binding NarL/FixJ family response regulator
MAETKPKRALICDQDMVLRRTLGELVTDVGFDVVGESSNVIEVLQQAVGSRATLVVLTIESLMLNPLEIIAELRQGADPPEVIVVSNDGAARAHALAVGACALTMHGDAEALTAAAAAVADVLSTGERRRRRERRTGQERRLRQDWSQVTCQRRLSDKRRARSRRSSVSGHAVRGRALP